jgi:hypothetical protein
MVTPENSDNRFRPPYKRFNDKPKRLSIIDIRYSAGEMKTCEIGGGLGYLEALTIYVHFVAVLKNLRQLQKGFIEPALVTIMPIERARTVPKVQDTIFVIGYGEDSDALILSGLKHETRIPIFRFPNECSTSK